MPKRQSGNKKNKQSNFAKLSIFQPNKYKFKKSCPLSVKGAPKIDYKNIKLLKKYTSENIVQYFNTVFGSPAKEKVDGVFPTTSLNAKLALENLDTQPGAKFAQGTFWNAFNTCLLYTSDAADD